MLLNMDWFLKRISTRNLPIEFGIKERTKYQKQFDFLVEKKVLKHKSNLDTVDCDLCEETHDCQVRAENNKAYYVCDKGSGKKELTNEELSIFEYDNDNFLKLLSTELGITTDRRSFKDEATYSTGCFFRLGVYEDKAKKLNVEVFYLRNSDDFEASMCFSELGTTPKVLITNTERGDIVSGKDNLFMCVLSENLLPKLGNTFLDKKAIAKALDSSRRVRFDKKQGNLFLDEKLIYTASLNGNHYQFLSTLWDKWMQQLSYTEIYSSVKNNLGGKSTRDETAQKFCQKMKNEIKNKCQKIEDIITTPTSGHYMMADPT
jgi:hypothetical protein